MSPAARPRTRLLPRLRAFFGLTVTELGQCLGLSREMTSQVERGLRPLPLPAALPQAALTLAQQATPPDPTPEAPDAAALEKHGRACQHRADQLAYQLTLLPARAAWARRRLAALPVLAQALAPAGTAPPAWLAAFAAEARAELARSGATAQARLAGRIAGLRAEADALAAPAPAAPAEKGPR